MSFSKETERKIARFAREQSLHYLDEAEMTYLEKLREKAGRARGKFDRKIARFRSNSDQAREASSDLFLYMSDYMNDLISQGLSEQDAYEKASTELASGEGGESDHHADFHGRIQHYYDNLAPEQYEMVGVFYGGLLFLGLAIGALIGFISGGALPGFHGEGWIYTLIGTGAGAVIGIGLGLLSHGIIVGTRKK